MFLFRVVEYIFYAMKKVSDILKEKAIGFVFNLVSLLVIVVILLLVIYAFAAFTEPSSAPSASSQDFAQNILGADNSNNFFSSTNVAANADGSIIERLENIQAKSIGTTDIGGVTGSITGSLAEMIGYLWDNRASFGAAVAAPYIDWADCETKSIVDPGIGATNTISCSDGYTLVAFSCSEKTREGSQTYQSYCKLSGVNSITTKSSVYASVEISASMKCCRYITP